MRKHRRRFFVEQALATCTAFMLLASYSPETEDDSTTQQVAAITGEAAPSSGVHSSSGKIFVHT
jgi:hypothetical protein